MRFISMHLYYIWIYPYFLINFINAIYIIPNISEFLIQFIYYQLLKTLNCFLNLIEVFWAILALIYLLIIIFFFKYYFFYNINFYNLILFFNYIKNQYRCELKNIPIIVKIKIIIIYQIEKVYWVNKTYQVEKIYFDKKNRWIRYLQ